MTRSPVVRTTFCATLLALSGCDAIGTKARQPAQRAPGCTIQTLYYTDALQMAVREMVAENDTTVHIRYYRARQFYKSLLAVYNARHIPARESILGIHARSEYSLHEIVVGVDKSVGWTEARQHGQRQTGFAPVDDLLEIYELSLKNDLDHGDTGAAVLRSKTPINPIGLRARFDEITGVRYVQSNGQVGGQTDIRADEIGAGVRLHYSRGRGDCVAGCIHKKTWTFEVDVGGSVTLEGVTVK